MCVIPRIRTAFASPHVQSIPGHWGETLTPQSRSLADKSSGNPGRYLLWPSITLFLVIKKSKTIQTIVQNRADSNFYIEWDWKWRAAFEPPTLRCDLCHCFWIFVVNRCGQAAVANDQAGMIRTVRHSAWERVDIMIEIDQGTKLQCQPLLLSTSSHGKSFQQLMLNTVGCNLWWFSFLFQHFLLHLCLESNIYHITAFLLKHERSENTWYWGDDAGLGSVFPLKEIAVGISTMWLKLRDKEKWWANLNWARAVIPLFFAQPFFFPNSSTEIRHRKPSSGYPSDSQLIFQAIQLHPCDGQKEQPFRPSSSLRPNLPNNPRQHHAVVWLRMHVGRFALISWSYNRGNWKHRVLIRTRLFPRDGAPIQKRVVPHRIWSRSLMKIILLMRTKMGSFFGSRPGYLQDQVSTVPKSQTTGKNIHKLRLNPWSYDLFTRSARRNLIWPTNILI